MEFDDPEPSADVGAPRRALGTGRPSVSRSRKARQTHRNLGRKLQSRTRE
jgi:hypothetical protein